jgi:eukaryotic-like serine/threonine-protein kinase
MTAFTVVPAASRTLAERLAEGKIPVPEALRYATILGEELRKLHDGGRVHGAVAPAGITVTADGLELLPPPVSAGEVSPYTAPEVVAGNPADTRSDLFSFGAVLYEMLTGRRAFEGDTPAALAESIAGAAPEGSGSPVVDRFLAQCLAKDPAARLQRIQKVLLELKLLTVAARRAEPQAGSRRDAETAALQAEMRQLDGRVQAHFQQHEETASAGERVLARVEQALDALAQRLGCLEQSLDALGQRVALAEQGFDALRQQSAAFQQSVASDFQSFENGMKAQGVAIESARTAMSQTDDLVERVVEALELLQSSVLDQAGERAAVN